MSQCPVKFIEGERIYLRALTPGDAAGSYPRWLNDRNISAGNSHHLFPYSRDSALEYIAHANQTKEHLILAVVLADCDQHIGNVALQNLHPVNHSADFSIMIGEPTSAGRGYGREAAALMFAHGFLALNLHRIACGTFSNNVAMQRIALSLGMKQEGLRRQAAFKNGRYLDIIEYGILAEEFMMQHVGLQGA